MHRRRVYLVLGSLLAVSLVLLILLEPGETTTSLLSEPEPESESKPDPEPELIALEAPEPPPPEKKPSSEKASPPAARSPQPKVAIIIDDVGYHGELDRSAANLPFPLTFSVLPGLDSSAASAALLRAAGSEIMLHLPMEPERYPEKNPGPGALFTFMTPEEIRRTIREDILSVPGARGVNNHMGSLFTVREDLLKVVFQELRRHGLFFIDSRTTTATAAQKVARRLGVRTARRSVFLDNSQDPSAITAQLELLFKVALKERSAVGIGHYRATTLQVLATEVPRLCRLHPQVELVFASDVVN